MIVLDTNILSELLNHEPNPKVWSWAENIAAKDLFVTTITVAEMRFGVDALPDGKRRKILDQIITETFETKYAGRVLPFDYFAAVIYGDLAARLRNQGQSKEIKDVMIASIALAHKAKIATRNTKDFEPTGVTLINPFLTSVD